MPEPPLAPTCIVLEVPLLPPPPPPVLVVPAIAGTLDAPAPPPPVPPAPPVFQ